MNSLDGFAQAILEYEVFIRMSFFFGIFFLMAMWELRAPRRTLTLERGVRWASNIGLVVLNSLVLRLIFPTAAVGVAWFAQNEGWGLLNYLQWSYGLSSIIAIILLDFVIYLQHVMVHAVPLFWRLHQVHHADLDYDVTTGSRFHTLEIILSMLIKFAAILLLGPPVVAVVIFEILLNATAMFNHSNIKIPEHVDRLLRLFVVTPDMHRVHHSVLSDESNSNFGFNLPWWDRIFGTYKAQPKLGHTEMQIGLADLRDAKQVSRLNGMLTLPFSQKAKGYALNDRTFD